MGLCKKLKTKLDSGRGLDSEERSYIRFLEKKPEQPLQLEFNIQGTISGRFRCDKPNSVEVNIQPGLFISR